MRRRSIAAFLGLGAVAVLAVFSQADALQSDKAYKEVVLTVVVTPSPTPVGFVHPAARPAMPAPLLARLVTNPLEGPVQLALAGASWDVAPGRPVVVAQSQAQPTPVPVQFVAKADPNAQYIHVIPHTDTLDVPYGTTTFTCAFEIYTYYTTAYTLTDWGYGTTKSGTGTYPILNYAATSDLSWEVPDLSTTVHAYANSGSPGETTWTGTAGQKQQHCFNLTVVVPTTQPAGTYTATIQYNLMVS